MTVYTVYTVATPNGHATFTRRQFPQSPALSPHERVRGFAMGDLPCRTTSALRSATLRAA
jgi:hypothetical protein